MRIASLVPSATELLFSLGLGGSVVGVTHECDYPPQATKLPSLTRSVLEPSLSAAAIDRAVRERTEQGAAIYELDEQVLEELAPDLIVTQAVCEVCAVAYDDVRAVADRLDSRPEVISLDPSTLGEVFADVRTLASAAGCAEAGEQLAAEAADRIDRVSYAVADSPLLTVAALEWLDPLFAGGHWVPQMIELAGGEDVLGFAGERSRVIEWEELEVAAPHVVVSMPCGYGTERAAEETWSARERLRTLGARVVAVDASSYFSRPGPRLVDGIELLGHILHPDVVPAPSGAGRFRELELAASAGGAPRR